jgi:hypothetical protein
MYYKKDLLMKSIQKLFILNEKNLFLVKNIILFNYIFLGTN